MSKLLRQRRRGFTLIELLVVIVIIGIIATLIIPMFLDALQKGKQKRTMAEMRIVGTCWMAWLTDQVASGAAGSTSARQYDLSDLTQIPAESVLQSLYQTQTFFYCSEVPRLDAWGWQYGYYVNTETLVGAKTIAIRATGRDGVFTGDIYPLGPFIATDYDQDIVWADGFFVRYPAGLAVMDAVPTPP